jgi:hypothetical protein
MQFLEENDVDFTESLAELCDAQGLNGDTFLKYRRGRLTLGPQFIRQMFERSLPHIGDHIKRLLLQPQALDCKNLFLVGGFGESPVLVAYMKKIMADEALHNRHRPEGVHFLDHLIYVCVCVCVCACMCVFVYVVCMCVCV